MRYSQLFVHIDIHNKNNVDGVHLICCGLHMYVIHLYSGKNAVFYMHKLLLHEVGTEKMQSLNLSRQIPIYSTREQAQVTSSWLGAPTHRTATTRIATVVGACARVCVFVRVCVRSYVRACVRDVFAIYYNNTLLKIIKGTHVRNFIFWSTINVILYACCKPAGKCLRYVISHG